MKLQQSLLLTESEIKIVKILVVCVSLLIISLFLWPWLGIPFITQGIDNVERVVVIIDPHYPINDERIIYITEQFEIGYLYGLLRRTTVTGVNRWPTHTSSLRMDREFIIHVEYKDGQVDQFHSEKGSRGDFIFRFLDTQGIDGDPGFIWGRNHNLWEHVRSLDPAAH